MFHLELLTHPNNYFSTIETWNTVEDQFSKALDNQFQGTWQVNPGDGVFYGSKIDVTIRNILYRSFQRMYYNLNLIPPYVHTKVSHETLD
ncbi:uncharacterized protein BJ212DRAFT_1486868 [Suillus subaureus]|uniref:Uncharacterized protein n=1 Tax=Suillus subaureus TaxID=48587 RepID=A0A9P7DVS4_9AGAM|nr:uncharacterized protein BJ212DRAFT_1486868 [Suillus subaureus]KAG1804140.1 hypothetical protein BJ212DRAFT_1486868 [Suillus subaureus]